MKLSAFHGFLAAVILISIAAIWPTPRYSDTQEGSSIVCYSGGRPLYEGVPEGEVKPLDNRDGWTFIDSETGKTLQVSGDCLISE